MQEANGDSLAIRRGTRPTSVLDSESDSVRSRNPQARATYANVLMLTFLIAATSPFLTIFFVRQATPPGWAQAAVSECASAASQCVQTPHMSSVMSSYVPSGGRRQQRTEKFITAKCDRNYGLGNKMYQMATLYGLGRTLGRQPYFHRDNRNQHGDLAEIAESFPNVLSNLRIMKPTENETRYVDFVDGCCEYGDPARLENKTAAYISLSSEFMQSYKFFQPYRREILDLFDFGLSIRKEADDYVASTIPGLKERHALCVHIRRGDFLEHPFLESTKEFVEAAVEFAVEHIAAKNSRTPFKAILFGEDEEFARSLKFSSLSDDHVHIHRPLRRGADLYFGARYCDSLVLSASGSTFAFWMAYLNERANVFYNAQVTDDPALMRYFVRDSDMFPEEWIRLVLANGTARHEQAWWH